MSSPKRIIPNAELRVEYCNEVAFDIVAANPIFRRERLYSIFLLKIKNKLHAHLFVTRSRFTRFGGESWILEPTPTRVSLSKARRPRPVAIVD